MTPYARENAAHERFIDRDQSFLAPVLPALTGAERGWRVGVHAAVVCAVTLFLSVGMPMLFSGL